MNHVRVNATVISDNTGATTTIPVILLKQGEQIVALEPLVKYLMAHSIAKSDSWMNKLCQVVGMLLDYMAANHEHFDYAQDLFKTFAQRVYAGTIDDKGFDPSGLYWLPKGTENANQLLNALSRFSDWMAGPGGFGTQPVNPWREATTYEQRLNWAAYMHKSHNSLLGHLDTREAASATSKQARAMRQRSAPSGNHGGPKQFPDDRLMDLFFEGFRRPGTDSPKDGGDIVMDYDWRGICITMLLHYGGLRRSEPFHLWVGDVKADPHRPDEALVRVYHPIDGAAPKDFKGPNGRPFANREAYLQARYPEYRPRNKGKGNRKAGWKNPRLDDINQKFMQVHWLPTGAPARHFLEAHKYYMAQRMREGIRADKHPFLYVSFQGKKGEPYTIDAYKDAHARAVRRIGLVPVKKNGTTPHGHRHAYAQRNIRGKTGPLVTQKGLHHKSIKSQEVYTEPSVATVTRAMDEATARLAAGESVPPLLNLDTTLLAEQHHRTRHLTTRRKKQS